LNIAIRQQHTRDSRTREKTVSAAATDEVDKVDDDDGELLTL